MHNHQKALEVFHEGTVIPATPLALSPKRNFDEQAQRILIRYYLESGVGGIATAVHSTQFAIRDCGLFEPVISIVSEEIDRFEAETGRNIVKICGVCGGIDQALQESRLAKRYGYDAVLLSPGGLGDYSEQYLLERTRKVAEILPVIGFYLQVAVGGRLFSYDYWLKTAGIPNVIGIKCASFNRYTTVDVVRAVCSSPREAEITLYTGNDDNIVNDFVSMFSFGNKIKRFEGGLLGHWCFWTKKAVALLQEVKEARKTGNYNTVLRLGPWITDMNCAVFDARNNFKGCIAGIQEVLYHQGLLSSNLCLNKEEMLSPGQLEEIQRVIQSYPELVDDSFVSANLKKWKRLS